MAINASTHLDDFSQAIELMLLDPELTLGDTLKRCRLAYKSNLASVFVKPCYIREAVDAHRNDGIRIGTVIGYPHGANETQIKLNEAKHALIEGAVEFEMVINIGLVRSGMEGLIRKEIQSVSGLIHMNGGVLKVILEAGYLTRDQIRAISLIAAEEKADWIATSTGYGPSINTLEIVHLMSECIGEETQLKAMGGITNLDEVSALIDAGCTRVGITNLSQLR